MENRELHRCTAEKPDWLVRFIDTYQGLSINNLDSLDKVYHQDIFFQDPLHHVQGYQALQHYFSQLYTNLSACEFVVKHAICHDNEAAIYWTMRFCHRQLKGGEEIEVSGHSLLKECEQRVVFHRDYLDVGEMLYEHLPIVGSLIRYVKKQAATS
jgi:hypothetical protein